MPLNDGTPSEREVFEMVAAIPNIAERLKAYTGENVGSRINFSRVEIEPGTWILQVEPIYSVRSVAKLLDLTEQVIRKYIKNGELISFSTRVGQRINHADLQAFLNKMYDPNANASKQNIQKARAALLSKDKS